MFNTDWGSVSRRVEEANQAKKQTKALREQERKWAKGYIVVHARLVCGCCTAKMRFQSQEAASAAFAKVGLKNEATIKDDSGETHEGVDTFYGFWLND
jgi:hypothetical protein